MTEGNIAHQPPRSRWPRWSLPAAIAATVAVIIAAFIVIGGTDNDRELAAITTAAITATTPATSSTSTTTTVVPDGQVDAAGAVVTIGDVTITVPPGSVAGTGTFVVTDTVPPDTDAMFEAAGPMFDITLDGTELIGPITITVPIDPIDGAPVTLDDGTIFTEADTVFMAHWTGDTWEPLDTSINRTAGTITATTTSLSVFGDLRVVGSFVADLARSLLQELTGGLYQNTPRPDCGSGVDDSGQWVSDADMPVVWCAHLRDDTRVVHVVNQRRYAITVTAPNATIAASTSDLASQLSGFATRPDVVALSPGDTATVTYPAGTTTATISSDYDGLAQSVTSLIVAADILAAIAARVPFSGTRDAQQFLRALDVAGCVTALGVDVTALVVNAASTIASLVRSCFDTVLRTSLGVIGTILLSPLVVVASTIAYFMSSANAGWDLITGGSRGRLALTASTTGGNPIDGSDAADCLNADEGWQLLINDGRWPAVSRDGFTVDRCDGMWAVGGPEDFWVVWERTTGQWKTAFVTFSGTELCNILRDVAPTITGDWC
jgi:hypothetical protein